MKILIVFATYSGSTEIVATNIEKLLKDKGHEVTIKNVRDTHFEDLSGYDLIFFGSPSWDLHGHGGMPHENFLAFIEVAKGKSMPDQKIAVFGLGDTAYPIFTGGVNHLEQLVHDLQAKLIGESLRIDGYFFNQAEADEKVITWIDTILTQASQ